MKAQAGKADRRADQRLAGDASRKATRGKFEGSPRRESRDSRKSEPENAAIGKSEVGFTGRAERLTVDAR